MADISRVAPRVTSSLIDIKKVPKTEPIINVATQTGVDALKTLAQSESPPSALFIQFDKKKAIKFDLSNVENRETLLADIGMALENVTGSRRADQKEISAIHKQFMSAYQTIMGPSSSGTSVEEAMGRAQSLLTQVHIDLERGIEGLATDYLRALSKAGIDFVTEPKLLTHGSVQEPFLKHIALTPPQLEEFNSMLGKIQDLPDAALKAYLADQNIAIPRALGPLPEVPGLSLQLTSDVLAVFRRGRDTSIKGNLGAIQACITEGINRQTESAFGGACHIASQLASGQSFNLGGHAIAVQANNYVLFASEQLPAGDPEKNNELFPGKKDSGVSYELNGGAPTYPGIRNAVDRALKAGEITEVELAQQVQKLLKTVGNEEQIPCHPMAAIITATLGLAEHSRNPKALSMLVMYTDLIIAGKATWAEGLGPTAVPDERPVIESTKDVLDYFKIPPGAHKIERGRNIETAAALLPEVLAKQLPLDGSGHVRAGNNGGDLPMVGGGSAGGVHSSGASRSREQSDLQQAIELVQFKEASVLVKWLELPQNQEKIKTKEDIVTLIKARLDL
jgi:hypothetical protein